MRAKGLRPVTVWAFDRRSPEMRDQLQRDCEAIAHAERTNPEAQADAEHAFAVSEAMLRHLDETEPYDWGPLGPPS